MKKIFSVALALCGLVNLAMSQCTIDASLQQFPGIYPKANDLPCVEQGMPYDQTIQVQNLNQAFTGIHVDSMMLTNVNGLPSGISWARTPTILYGGANGCLKFTGTTNDAVGQYKLAWIGTVWFTLPFLGAQMYSGDLTRFGGANFNYSMFVITSGEQCTHLVGINDVSPELNSSIVVYPNPNNGVFEIRLNAAHRLQGDMQIVDMTGRVVYNQKLDLVGLYNTQIDLSSFAKGLYTLQVRTADGFASRNISVE